MEIGGVCNCCGFFFFAILAEQEVPHFTPPLLLLSISVQEPIARTPITDVVCMKCDAVSLSFSTFLIHNISVLMKWRIDYV